MSAPVLTLNDLSAWPRSGVHLAVLGHPIGHSVSPAMHNAALAELARGDTRFADWHYHRFEVAPEALPGALPRFRAAGFLGLNLTVPHKIIAFEHVRDIAPQARPIGAVNTLVNTGGGWRGHNTDGYGLSTALAETLGVHLSGADVLLLGAGGAARGAAVECLQQGVASLRILNRTERTRDALLAQIAPIANGLRLEGIDPRGAPGGLPEGLLVINATSAGLRADDAPPVDLKQVPRPRAVFDMIYNPAVTPLLAQAHALGIPSANGLAMLVHQGVRSLQHWITAATGNTAPEVSAEAMRTAAEVALRGTH